MIYWSSWQQDWLLYHKAIFDGINRIIYIAPNTSSLSVKIDLYSSWKEWITLRDNAKFLPAFRTIGGDPLGDGKYAGDMYFLMNNWQIYIDQNIKVDGILYHDNGIDPYVILPGGGVTSTVSSLAIAVETGTGGGTSIDTVALVNDIWNKNITSLNINGSSAKYVKDILTNVLTVPTTSEITTAIGHIPTAQEISTEIGHIPTTSEISSAVWSNNQWDAAYTIMREVWGRLGLDITKPLITNNTSITFGDIVMAMVESNGQVTVARQ